MALKGFREITIGDKNLIQQYLEKSGFIGSEYSFPSLFMWRLKYGYMIAEHDGFLFILVQDEGSSYFFYPPGRGDIKKAIEKMYLIASESGNKFYLTSITKESVAKIESLFPGKFKFSAHRNYFDYIYNAEDLINLPGRKYHAKRNYINRFIQEYGEIHYEDITPENVSECREAYNKWLNEKKEKGANMDMFADESCAMKECFDNYRQMSMRGGLVRARGNICSFSFGSYINSETLGIHIEKSLVNCQGGYAVINREFAAKNASACRYINREEDLGLKGLRRAKLSYHPAFLLEKHLAAMKGGL